MSAMAQRFGTVGAPPHLATLAEHNLRELLADESLDRRIDDAVAEVMSGFGGLDVHPDVPDGLRALHSARKRLVTLSNGATAVADGLLSRAGVRDLFEQLLSVQDADRWKPAPEAYAYGLAACGVDAGEAMLAAVHPWDIDGARRCGLRTAWINPRCRPYPPSFTPPEVTVDSVTALALALIA